MMDKWELGFEYDKTDDYLHIKTILTNYDIPFVLPDLADLETTEEKMALIMKHFEGQIF